MNYEKILNDPNLICWVRLTRYNFYDSYNEWLVTNGLSEEINDAFDNTKMKLAKAKNLTTCWFSILKVAPHTRNENLLVLCRNRDGLVVLMNLEETEIFFVGRKL